MKKNLLGLTLMVLFGLAISSCQKDDETQNNNNNSNNNNNNNGTKVKTMTFTPLYYNTDTATYTYDSQGRLSSKSAKHIDFANVTCIYLQDTVLEVRNSGIDTLVLNSEGYVKNGYRDGLFREFSYDAEGHVISDGLNTYTWNDGNLVNIKDSTGTIWATYTYYPDKVNTIGNANFGQSYLGKDPKNLVLTMVRQGYTYTITYGFDSLGRVTSTSGYGSYTYTYY